MFKYILVPSTGAETDTPVFATALAVARLSAAHLVFLHVRVDIQQIMTALASSADTAGGVDYQNTIEDLERRCAQRHRKAEQAFRDFCAQEQLTVPGHPSLDRPSAEWRVETGDETLHFTQYGRTADLIVMGRARDSDAVGPDLLEASLMASGRPVLIAPAETPNRLTGTVAIAWKNTAEAARAVAAARPFIETAGHVIVFSVDEDIELGEPPCEEIREALSWHNPNTSLQRLVQEGRAPVETLLAASAGAKADLLVMGAYGHSRVREMIFGGLYPAPPESRRPAHPHGALIARQWAGQANGPGPRV